MKSFVLLIVCFFAFACDRQTTSTAEKPVYYDVAGYIKSQIQAMSAQKPTVTKNALINRQTNNQTTKGIDWAKELELFAQADINKSAFRTSYVIARPDSLTYQYTLKPTEERLTVRELVVKLDPISGKPAQITAVLKTENLLYTSERRLFIESGAVGTNSWGVRHYRVEGFQKLTYFERNDFRVDVAVTQ